MVLSILLVGLVARHGAGAIEVADLRGSEGAFIHEVAKPQNAGSMKLGEKGAFWQPLQKKPPKPHV